MARLTGKHAVVTGASTGIGAAVARALAAEGAAVIGFARRFEATRLAAPPPPGEVIEVALDVTDERAVVERFAELPGLDILVCSAGVGWFSPVVTTEVAKLRAMLEVHVVGTFLCAREALRRMQVQRGGHIVTVCSIAAHRAFAECAAYTAAKAGQLGLTRVLAEEARPYDVRVTALLPGATDTSIWDDRPGFDRSKMMQAGELAGYLVETLVRPGVAVEELVVMPPAGAL
jgi:NAD(P)-dependent dehydrogenase (short-subunit alcohol dehydrogenase family)